MRELRRGHPLLFGDRFDRVRQLHVLLQRLLGKTRVGAPPVAFGQVFDLLDRPRQEPRDRADCTART